MRDAQKTTGLRRAAGLAAASRRRGGPLQAHRMRARAGPQPAQNSRGRRGAAAQPPHPRPPQAPCACAGQRAGLHRARRRGLAAGSAPTGPPSRQPAGAPRKRRCAKTRHCALARAPIQGGSRKGRQPRTQHHPGRRSGARLGAPSRRRGSRAGARTGADCPMQLSTGAAAGGARQQRRAGTRASSAPGAPLCQPPQGSPGGGAALSPGPGAAVAGARCKPRRLDKYLGAAGWPCTRQQSRQARRPAAPRAPRPRRSRRTRPNTTLPGSAQGKTPTPTTTQPNNTSTQTQASRRIPCRRISLPQPPK
jgi:hypothetical protein